MGWLVGYVVAVGTLNATLQVTRGLTRGAGKLIEGRPREALAEAAGGLLAPLLQAADQYARLALDAYGAACAIAGQEAGNGRGARRRGGAGPLRPAGGLGNSCGRTAGIGRCSSAWPSGAMPAACFFLAVSRFLPAVFSPFPDARRQSG
jgi:hypothetical protein